MFAVGASEIIEVSGTIGDCFPRLKVWLFRFHTL
jgi:hypothetical protein